MAKTDSERLAVIEAAVTNIEKRLFGNGQPGDIEELHERINGHGKRLSILENWRWWLIGICFGIGAASGLGISELLKALMK